MQRTRATIALGLIAGALSLGGCVSTPEDAPQWLRDREAALRDDSYPSLQDVPRSYTANTDAAYWARIEADLMATGAAVKANPRAAVTPQEDPNAFLEDARGALEATRQSHE